MKELWLDLEDTVITPVEEGWSSSWLLPYCQVLAEHLAAHPIDKLHVFSFAIHTQEDVAQFDQWIRPHLEKVLGMPISCVPTVQDDIIPACRAVTGINGELPLSDVVSFWGKAGAFKLWIKWLCQTGRNEADKVVLIDDAVWTELCHWPDWNLQVDVIRIHQEWRMR